MRFLRSAIVLAAACALWATPLRAGDFIFEAQCQQTTDEPPRYRLRFLLVDTHAGKTFCQVRLDPTSVDGSIPQPVRAVSAPARLVAAIDGTSATFTATPCLPPAWHFYDSLFVVVDAVPAYFNATLFMADGGAEPSMASFPCANPVSVEPIDRPGSLRFEPPAPNPARETTQLSFVLPREAHVRLGVYDIAGRLRATLADATMPAGRHVITWDLRDDRGQPTPTGLYLVRLEFEGHAVTRSLLRSR